MNSSMNLHRVTSIKAQMKEVIGHKFTEFVFTDEEGNQFTLAVLSAEWLPIEGADHINFVAQEVAT